MEIASKSLLVLLLPLVMLVSCKEPRERYEFAFSDPIKDNNTTYNFKIDLSNSQCTYNTYIACRYSTTIVKSNSLSFDITATSPSGQSYYEKISLPLHSNSPLVKVKKNNGSVIDIQWPYRDNITIPVDTGIWNISVTITDTTLVNGIYGMGFSYNNITPDTK